MSIKPTVGRIVHYHKGKGNDPRAAIITKVHDDEWIGATVFHPEQGALLKRRIALVPVNCIQHEHMEWCSWMPYQVKKSYGSESGEKEAGEESIDLTDDDKEQDAFSADATDDDERFKPF